MRYLSLRKFLHRCRIVLDLLVSIFLLILLSIWATRYLLVGDPVIAQIEQLFGTDKAMHLLLGFFLPLCVGWLLRIYRRRRLTQAGCFLLVAVAYAADECFQSTLSYRSASLDDFLMSVTGLLLAVAVWYSLLSLTSPVYQD
jgi:VanZ family protein